MYQEIDNYDMDDSNDDIDDDDDDNTSKNNDVKKNTTKNNEMTVSMLFRILLYGVVNVIMAVPSMYGYAAVIFRDIAYVGDMASLAKLVCFSSAIHQVTHSSNLSSSSFFFLNYYVYSCHMSYI